MNEDNVQESMKDQLIHIILPVRRRNKPRKTDLDIEIIDPFERMEKAIRRDSEKNKFKESARTPN